jgi:hypothetical protein
MDTIVAYLGAFGLTLAIELPLYVLGLRLLVGVDSGKSLTAGLLGNLASHPLIWFGLYPSLLGEFGLLPTTIIVELFAMLVEWLIVSRAYGALSSRLLVASLLANASSFVFGRIVLG